MSKINSTVICNYKSGISRIIINDPATYNALSSKTLKSLINIFRSLNNNDKTKVIIPVHFSGIPCDMDAIHAIAKKHEFWFSAHWTKKRLFYRSCHNMFLPPRNSNFGFSHPTL